ncbi:MAG: HutD family protein [Luteimonas sp.]
MDPTETQPPCVLRANDYRRERWRNGAGWTRQIHAEPSKMAGFDWDWRLSIAEVDADAPFSIFPGVERELVLLQGNGLRLRFEDGASQELMPPHERMRFSGERALAGELLDGPTVDFNLMWRRDAVNAQLWHRPLVGTMLVFVEPGDTWALHLLGGTAHFSAGAAGNAMVVGDTALLRSGRGRRRYMLEGGGELLVICISPL